jgi:hypothetical protein
MEELYILFMKILLLSIILVTLFSCTLRRSETSDSFRTLISDTSITHRPGYEIGFSKRQSELLNLPFIFNGVDSFELRIWSFGFWTRRDLFVLRYSQNRWISSNYIYYDKDNIIDSLHLVTKQIARDTASKIQHYLIQDSILNLPSQIAIPNFQDNTADGETYYEEIATKKFYKHLRYRNPKYFNDTYHKQFLRMLDSIQAHFNIPYTY